MDMNKKKYWEDELEYESEPAFYLAREKEVARLYKDRNKVAIKVTNWDKKNITKF